MHPICPMYTNTVWYQRVSMLVPLIWLLWSCSVKWDGTELKGRTEPTPLRFDLIFCWNVCWLIWRDISVVTTISSWGLERKLLRRGSTSKAWGKVLCQYFLTINNKIILSVPSDRWRTRAPIYWRMKMMKRRTLGHFTFSPLWNYLQHFIFNLLWSEIYLISHAEI